MGWQRSPLMILGLAVLIASAIAISITKNTPETTPSPPPAKRAAKPQVELPPAPAPEQAAGQLNNHYGWPMDNDDPEVWGASSDSEVN